MESSDRNNKQLANKHAMLMKSIPLGSFPCLANRHSHGWAGAQGRTTVPSSRSRRLPSGRGLTELKCTPKSLRQAACVLVQSGGEPYSPMKTCTLGWTAYLLYAATRKVPFDG